MNDFSPNPHFLTAQKPRNSKAKHRTTYNDKSVEKYFNKKYTFQWKNEWKLPESDWIFRSEPWEIPKLIEMKDQLNLVKGQLEEFDLDEWSQHTKRRDTAGTVFRELKKHVKPELLTQVIYFIFFNSGL